MLTILGTIQASWDINKAIVIHLTPKTIMTPNRITKISKRLSYVLRHHPESIGIQLTSDGWAETDVLLDKFRMTLTTLKYVVEHNDKKRFAFNEDYSMIRANQGHSIQVDLQLEPKTPPPTLFHGTATHFLDSILKKGLLKQSRHHVHLSAQLDTAIAVGKRHGKVVVLEIDTQSMLAEGHQFYLSNNGVWLTDIVDPKYIEILKT